MSYSTRSDYVEENFVRERKEVIDNLAARAVKEYNDNHNSSLEFIKVVSSRQQEIPRILYITLEAKLGSETKRYEVKFIKRGRNYIQENFKPVAEVSSSFLPHSGLVSYHSVPRFRIKTRPPLFMPYKRIFGYDVPEGNT
ncbi:Cysteine proteinase inhibitor [Quillaja saponaria]|uniref:Cysteine proteinase inhibitor n=1 Tax=Quillaja saponaria TaxID=32244 RepID=A0AAD7LVC6_QUISA|nr:Cysteine proteinase inhibitor [Quillaja saponaria]